LSTIAKSTTLATPIDALTKKTTVTNCKQYKFSL